MKIFFVGSILALALLATGCTKGDLGGESAGGQKNGPSESSRVSGTPKPEETPIQVSPVARSPISEEQQQRLKTAVQAHKSGDFATAISISQSLADEGCAEGQYALAVAYESGLGVEKNLAEAVRWYRKSADQGFAGAQNNLGVCYQGGVSVEKDLAEAVRWFRKAADQGFADAQHNLGVCYHGGAGVEKDLAEAVRWYRKAADQGFANGQYNLGVCY